MPPAKPKTQAEVIANLVVSLEAAADKNDLTGKQIRKAAKLLRELAPTEAPKP